MALSKGKVVALGLGVGALLIAGAAFMLAPRFLGASASAASPAHEKADTSPGPMYVLKERVVNLADAGARRYLKVSMSLEFTTGAEEFRKASPEERQSKQAEFEKSIAKWMPIIDDTIITLVSAKTSAELAGGEGKERLKDEIKNAVNRRLGGEQVSNVYFTQFVMQ